MDCRLLKGRSVVPVLSAWVLLACGAGAAEPSGVTGLVPGDGYRCLGTVKPRHAREIQSSNWSVGAETMDRDFTIYRNWRAYLGPLGVKAARVQSGWAKTEKEKGKYQWAWLDEIIPDMVEQGVKPWVCLCYGNPIYEGGGVGWGVPTSEVARAALDRYVAAVVERYGKYVDHWEIWNEPASPSAEYADIVAREARVIRKLQPRAFIIAAAWKDTKGILERLKQLDALSLVNEFTYHPYTFNPDDTYRTSAPKLRELLTSYAPHLTLRQGENGAPSKPGTTGALCTPRGSQTPFDWTEEKQAKWALRRLLGDLGRDIYSSYFSICDMHYTKGVNFKGLLATNADKTVQYAKPSYYAVQRITAIFDNRVQRINDFTGTVTQPAEGNTYSLFAYRTEAGAKIATLWRDSQRPGDRPEKELLTVTLPGLKFNRPVWVDLLGGRVYAIDDSLRSEKDGATVIRQVPAYDSVVLIAEQDAIPLQPTKP